MAGRWYRAAIAAALALAACRGDETTEPVPPAESAAKSPAAPATHGVTVRHSIHPSLPELSFALRSEQDASGMLRVSAIEVRSGHATEPVQVIDGIDAEAAASAGTAPLEVLDMNFDGYLDLRIVQFRSAGPNTPYLNWLFDPASGRFVESRALNELVSPRFDANRREIRSEWRDGPTRYGMDVYAYESGRLVPVRKEERAYRGPGVYDFTVSRFEDGAWKTIRQEEVREAQAPVSR